MQAGRAAGKQALAEVGDEVEAEGADRVGVIAHAFEAAPHPARQLGTAGVGEARQLEKTDDGHDAGNDRDVDAPGADFVDEMEIGVGVVEVLGDRRVGAGLGFAREGVEVVLRIARLRMPFGVGGDGDLEVVAGFAADEFDEFVGVAEFAGLGHARGQVAAQGDEAADAGGAVVGKDVADVLPRRADAGEVRRGVEAFGGDVLDDGEGALARRAAGTEGH